MPDRKKVIKGLELCLKTIDEPDCRKECSYYEACQKYEGRVIFQPLMRDTLALLKEQEAVVHCKDCKYWSAERINDYNKCRRWIKVGVKNFATTGDWFCADGERKEGR